MEKMRTDVFFVEIRKARNTAISHFFEICAKNINQLMETEKEIFHKLFLPLLTKKILPKKQIILKKKKGFEK